MREFERREVEVWVITTDARVEERGCHVILADRAATVSATYGVAFQVLGGANRPATFVIDRQGIIRFQYRAGQKPGCVFTNDEEVSPEHHWSYDRPSMNQLLKVLDALPGIPVLNEARKDKLARLSKASVATLADALKDEDSYVRAEAARRLAEKGPDSIDALPALIAALGDKVGYVRSEAAKAIGRIGPAAKSAMPRLLEAFKDTDEGVRLAVGIAFRDLGPDAKAAMPLLLEAGNDWNAEVRGVAESALSKIGPVAIPEYTKELRNRDPHVRARMARILGGLGPEAKSSVPELLVATKDKYWGTRRAAIVAIGKLDPQADGFLPVLLEALKDDEVGAVRNTAAVTLGSFGKQKDVVLPALAEALKDKDSWVRLGVAQATGRLSPGDRRIVEVLIGILKDEEPDIRNGAAATLRSIDPEAAEKAGIR
jgi:HEAT repeat protein